jgi:hypothetical protein
VYEHRTAPLLPRRSFLRRLAAHFAGAVSIVVVSLGIGTEGYHTLGGQGWLDAFLNASMILGGMGQVGEVASTAGKLFAAFFALYAGLVLITVPSLILAPVIHRILHKLHLESDDPGDR